MPESRIKLEFHDKQLEAFHSSATEIGYGGAAGGGKSFLLRGAAIHACTQIANFTAFLFRKHYDELISNHVDGAGGFREILAPWIATGQVKIVESEVRFWNGSKIRLCHISQNKDLDKFLGPEIPLLLIDQAEQFPERWIRFLRARCRIPNKEERLPAEYRNLFPRCIFAFNPGGLSSPYWRKQFVKAAKPLDVWRTPPSEGGMLRQFVPAFLRDNPSLSEEEYSQALQGLNDVQQVRALLEGDFDALVGNFFTQYEEGRHVVADFLPPQHWFKFSTFDWGSSEPFCFYWWCVSDGEQFIDQSGKKRWFPTGALIAYREWYGCNPDKPSQGIEYTNEQMCKGYTQRTTESHSGLVITDSKPFHTTGHSKNGKKYNIADEFLDHGVRLTQGNTARVYGWKQIRDRLIGTDGFAMLYLTESCGYGRDYLPAIPTDDKNREDAASSGETTHSPDAIRYACTTRPFVIHAPPTAEKLDKILEAANIKTPASILKTINAQKSNGAQRNYRR